MSVQVENLTDYPTREVERLVRFAHREMEVDHANILVRVKRSSWGVRGRYYCHARLHGGYVRDGWGGYKEIRVDAGTATHLITIGIAGPRQFPQGVHYYARKELPPKDIWESWQEALVWVCAHEANHHWQWLNRAKRRNGRRRWQFVESECDFAGYRILRRWRERRTKRAA